MLQSIYGSISNIATSQYLTFGGNLGLTYGPQISIEWDCDWLGIEDGEYSLCEIDLGATISTNGDILGTASLNCLGGFITGGGEVMACGGNFSMKGNFGMLNECITITGELKSSHGGVTISGQGQMNVPKSKYFGPLAGMGMAVNAFADFSKRYVMAWENIVVFGNTFSVGIKCTFDGDVDLLGSSDLLGGDEFGSSGPSYSVNGLTPHSVASPDGASASKVYVVEDYGVSLFQVSFTVSETTVSLVYNEIEYTQEKIAAGTYGNMQIVGELTNDTCITIAVTNAALGDWTINAYGDAEATFGAFTLAGAAPSPTINAVVLGEGERSATIQYTLPDYSALDNAVISIFRNDGGETGYNGQLLAEIALAEANGVYEYIMTDDIKGGDYSFYLMASSDNYAPVYGNISEELSFRIIDTEAPDQIQRINAEWSASGSTLEWSEPYDDNGVAGYQVRYRASEEEVWSEGETAEASFAFDNVPNGTYAYQVAAYDGAGNLGAWSEEGSIWCFPMQTPRSLKAA